MGPAQTISATAPGADLLGDRRLIIFREIARLARIGEWTGPETFALFQPAQARHRVGDEARLPHLAIADDVEAGVDLLAHAIAHRVAHPFGIGLLVDRVAVHARQHQLEQIVRPRQAADVRGQDTFGAEFHFSIPAASAGDYGIVERAAAINEAVRSPLAAHTAAQACAAMARPGYSLPAGRNGQGKHK
jgi:hypothetical protein